ncbi:MAG: enoyl-CoA hydratase/isomerase family protein [Sulfolobus sp.]
MTYETLEVEKIDSILIVTFNRPEKLNAWNTKLVNELTDLMKTSEEDNNVRVIVLTGKGKAFSVGGDLNEFLQFSPTEIEKFNRKVIELFRFMEKMRKPIIASVNGYCNLETIQATDLVIASKSAKFGLPEINVAVSPGAGILVRLPRIIGKFRAKEIAFLGEWISADKAKEYGLVNFVVEDEKLRDETLGFAKKLSEKAPISLGAIKAVINNSPEMSLDEAMEYQLKENSFLFYTEDLKEGIKAFLEKRKPIYKGR